MKRILFFIFLVVVIVFVGVFVYRSVKSPTTTVVKSPTIDLNDQNATYVIHGAADFGYGPGYYLYILKEGKTTVARVDGTASVDLKYLTDRPILIEGKVRNGDLGLPIVIITLAKRKE